MDDLAQHRPTTLATHGIVAAPHALASQAGLAMLREGGNALDAAIAANAVLQVVYPFVCGLGGDIFFLLHDARTRQLYALNGSGRAPQAATPERYHTLGYQKMPRHGIHAVTVPGVVDGWETALKRFGRFSLDRVLQPAIQYAEEGFPVGPGLRNGLTRMSTAAHTHRSFRENYLPGDAVPVEGSIARAPNLAKTYRAIAKDGAETYYRGAVAEQIADFFAREGGLITREDLAAHTSDWVTPLAVRFGDLEVYELPPNTQGVTALQMLGMLDRLELGAGPLAPETVHLMVEAKKLAFADRAAYLTDPKHMRVDPAKLLTPDYLRAQAQRIDPARATPAPVAGTVHGDTIYLCAADAAGNAVSLIQSNYMGFGSGYVVDGTGISLQNRGASFSLDPEAANVIAPGKRPLHTLIPSMALRDGRPAVVFGTMGGDGQPQTHAQVYTALQRYGLNIQAAIEMPRWVHGADEAGQPEVLRLEDRYPATTVAALAAMGHAVAELAAYDSACGHAHGITIDQEHGVLSGGADPRAEGIAAGW